MDVEVYASPGMDNETLIAHMQGMSMEQEIEINPYHALFSWMEDEDAVLRNDAIELSSGASQVQSK